MRQLASTWWNQLRVQQKVWVILLGLFIPLVCALAVHVSLVDHLLTVQQQRRDTILAREQVQILRRLGVDVEDAFRGYLLTKQDAFLKPLDEAELKLKPRMSRMLALVHNMPDLAVDMQHATSQLESLLQSKRTLIQQYRAGHEAAVLRYVRSGEGLRMSDAVRDELRVIENRLERNVQRLEADAAAIAQYAFWGLLLAVAGVAVMGLIGARLLAASITGPLAILQSSVAALGQESGEPRLAELIAVSSADEIGQLARAYEEMAGQVHRHIRELEALNAVGSEISTMGPDGLDGALHRITNRAAELIGADVCLVMLRNEKMGCWVIEAASGDWNKRLYKTVMLWEEFPVSVQAFESKGLAFGENLRNDRRPEMRRRNLMGESMLSIPLLSQGTSFGVLVLLKEQSVSRDSWNMRLAKGFADEAAMAITNARLYERVKEEGKGLQARLRQLEHLAETLAHDLRSPGERMGEFAALLMGEYGNRLDERATRWLRFIEENGRLLRERVEDMLAVARIGGRTVAIEAVDPALVIQDVLKSRAGELERQRTQVRTDGSSPMVACHRAYFHQAMDNLVSNAIKFSADRPDPSIAITWKQAGDRVKFSVSDNGAGIPESERRLVFEPFVRLHPDTTKGSGIGLAIVRRIVELYDGEVWIESGVRGGCTVSFTLPVLGEFSSGRS
ncbi:MAG: CHASE3 domain-containing protein [Nitrospirae bacterium]|nr:CHASE3 domain-containing protein [Nitrospirota bacterium]